MVTIKEIARRANVSGSTVSRVLNDGYASEEVRQRVMKVIEETGYIPSEQAKSLRTRKTKAIGVVVPRLNTDTSGRFVNALNDELDKAGYQIILANTNLDPKKEIENLKLLKSRQVDGIILLATHSDRELLDTIEGLNVPFLAVGQQIPHIPSIVNDDYHAAKDITSLLIKKGHEKIAFIGVPEEDPAVGTIRKLGYLDTLKDYQLAHEQQWIAEANFDFETGYRAMKQIIQTSDTLPTAVLAVTDKIGIGAMQYLKDEGFIIPDDIAIVGMGNATMSKYVEPPLTTIDFLNEQTGIEASSLILNLIQKPHVKGEKRVMNYRLIERNSV